MDIEKRIMFFTAFFLLLWGSVNTFFLLFKYGSSGMFFWFSNLSLFLTAFAILKKNKSFLAALFSILYLTETFLVADNLWRYFFRRNLFNIVEFMYHGGVGLFEFTLSHHHFFTLLAVIYGLFLIEKKEKDNSHWILLFLAAVVIPISFLFSEEENINCVYESCLPFFNFKYYSVIWPLFLYVLTFFIAKGVFRFLERVQPWILKKKRIVRWCYIFCVFIAIIFTIADIKYKKSLPFFTCSDMEDSRIKVKYLYTQEYGISILKFVYSVKNKTSNILICATKIHFKEKIETINEFLEIPPRTKLKLSAFLVYPKVDTFARLSAICYEELFRKKN